MNHATPWRDRASLRALISATVIVIAGCGGGGGGAEPASVPTPAQPPAPAPSLVITPTADSATVGDAAIPLHARVTPSGADVQWTLEGPGALSATSGADVQYLPPDQEALIDPATATITATSGSSLRQQVSVALSPAPAPGRHWVVVRSVPPTATKVAVGNGGFLALTASGYATSSDGSSWTDASWGVSSTDYGGSVYEAAWGDAGWLVVARFGLLASTDGVHWTLQPALDVLDDPSTHVVVGNHRYVVFGGSKTHVSTDGVHWTDVALRLFDVASAGGRFMAFGVDPANVSQTLAYVSNDGLAWQPTTQITGLHEIEGRDTDFISTAFGTLYDTADGLTWISSTGHAALQGGGSLTYTGGTLFEFAGDSMAVLTGASEQRVSVDELLAQPNSVASTQGRFVGVSYYGWITTSADALHWNVAREGGIGSVQAADFLDGRFVGLSFFGYALSSTDAVNWTRTEVLPHGSSVSNGFGAHAMAHGGGVAVAVGTASVFGSQGGWVRSIDGGATWAPAATAGPASPLTAVVHDGRRFVAATVDGTLYESPDGIAWSWLSTLPAASQVRSLAFGAGMYVVVDLNGVSSSPDGLHWTAAPALAPPVGSNVAVLHGATWDGTRFIVVGDFVSATSTDGVHWTRGDMTTTASAVVAAGGEIVAGGYGAVQTSRDGIHWSLRYLPGQKGAAAVLAFGNGRFVGFDGDGNIAVSDH